MKIKNLEHSNNNSSSTSRGVVVDTRVSTPSPLHSLLSKQVTRSQFIKILGLAVISILGFSTIIHFLTGKHAPSKIVSMTTTPLSSNYGHKTNSRSKL